MKKIKLSDALILFAGLGFLTMYINEVLYKGNPMSDSYFFLMFGIAGVLWFLYRRSKNLNDKK